MAYMIKENVWAQDVMDSLAEWSKALAQGASPQGRGFEPHSCHFAFRNCVFVFSFVMPNIGRAHGATR